MKIIMVSECRSCPYFIKQMAKIDGYNQVVLWRCEKASSPWKEEMPNHNFIHPKCPLGDEK